MSITLEQLSDRNEARNPAQWDWRVLNASDPRAGNCAILNLRFKQVIKPARHNRTLRKIVRKAQMRQRFALCPQSWRGYKALKPFHKVIGRTKLSKDLV
jgi:hypothetical protein